MVNGSGNDRCFFIFPRMISVGSWVEPFAAKVTPRWTDDVRAGRETRKNADRQAADKTQSQS